MNDKKKAKIHFICTVDGNIVDSTYERTPFEIQLGSGELLDVVESKLLTMNVGDKAEITVGSDNAYGDIKEDLFKSVELTKMPTDAKIGDVIDGETEDGVKFQCRLINIDIENNKAILNFNHPFAGKELIFGVELLELY